MKANRFWLFLVVCLPLVGCYATNLLHQMLDPAPHVQIVIYSSEEIEVGVGGVKVASDEVGGQLRKLKAPKHSPIFLVHRLGEDEELVKKFKPI